MNESGKYRARHPKIASSISCFAEWKRASSDVYTSSKHIWARVQKEEDVKLNDTKQEKKYGSRRARTDDLSRITECEANALPTAPANLVRDIMQSVLWKTG